MDENGFVHGNYGDRQFGYTPGWSTYNGPVRKGVAAYAQIMLYYNYVTGAYFRGSVEGECIGGQIPQVGPESEKEDFLNIFGIMTGKSSSTVQ